MNKLVLYLNYVTFFISCIVPKKKTRWIFGAWFGTRISDNPLALYRYIVNTHPEIEAIWICDHIEEGREAGVRAIRRDSVAGIWACLTAAVSVMNQGYLDFGTLNWIHKSYKVQLWHGVPWKKIGEDTKETKRGILHELSHRTYLFVNRCDLYIAPSEETKKVIKSAFLTGDENILMVGQPRNEILFDPQYCSEIRRKIEAKIGNYSKIIVYMPTFRDGNHKSFSFTTMGKDIMSLLEAQNAVILEKQHFIDCERGNAKPGGTSLVINAMQFDTQELLAAADVLVTDYSSCFFDFILTDRPVIHYLYDYEFYKTRDRGLYYNLDYVVSGEVVYVESKLCAALETALQDPSSGSDRRRLIRERFATYECCNNSELVTQRIKKTIGIR